MANYTVQDPQSGKTVTFMWGDPNPPTDADMDQIFAEASTQKPEQPGFLQRIADDFTKRGQTIVNQFSGPRADISNPEYQPSGRRNLQAAGAVAGGVGDLITESAKGLYNTFVPDSITQGIKNTAQGAWGALPTGVQDVAKDTVGYWGDKLEQINQNYPEAVKDVGAVANIGALVPAGKLAKGGANLVSDAATLATLKSPAKIDSMIDAAIDSGIRKGIKPTIVGKSNAGLVKKYYDDAHTAIKDIVEINPQSIPQTLEDFSQSVRSTKKQLWEQSHAMAVGAGEEGAMVDLAPIRSELFKVITAKNIQQEVKDSAENVLKNIATYENKISPVVAEDLLSSFNSKTKNFFKNPDFNSTNDAVMVERTARNLRSAIDSTIEEYKGPGYQDLKKRYGAQTAIEKNVTDRATVDARKNLKGFFDLTDVMTSQEFVYGLATLNPAHLVAAATGRGVKAYIKHINDPNKIVKDMFDTVGALQKIRNGAEMKTGIGKRMMDNINNSENVLSPYSQPTIPIRPSPTMPSEPRNFSLVGEPYGPEVMDANFTSREVPALPAPFRNEPQKLLPSGQGFDLPHDPWPMVSNTKLRDGYLKMMAEDFLKR